MPTIDVPLVPPEPDPPTPRELKYDASPHDAFVRRQQERHAEIQEIIDTETEEQHARRVYSMWVNPDGETFAQDHMTIDDVRVEAATHTADCGCWRHRVISHWERTHDSEANGD